MKKLLVARSPIHLEGLFVAEPVRAGEVICPIDDSRLVTPEAPLRPELGEREEHCDWFVDEEYGKVVLMRAPERHINHSCSPSSWFRTVAGVREVVALRDLAAGDEVTWDYCISRSFPLCDWDCACGSERCRGRSVIDYFALPGELQREYRPLLDVEFVAVHGHRLRP